MLNIHLGFELWVYLHLIPTHHQFHQCSGHPRDHRFGRTNGNSTCFILWIECDWYHVQSPIDPSVFIAGPILRFEDYQPEQQPDHHNDHWRPQGSLYPHHGGHLHTDDYPLRSIDKPVPRYRGNIMWLKGKFELQLTIEDVYEQVLSSIPPMNQLSRIEVLRSGRRWSWTTLSHLTSVAFLPCHSIPISCYTTCQPIK